MKPGARAAAVEALLQVSQNEGYSNIVLNKVLRARSLERRDRALASILFYGSLEKRITLDFYLSRFLKKPGAKLSEPAKEILRTAVYQILFLEKIPDSAAVNESVELAKAYRLPAGFINGVLRALLREKDSLQLPTGEDAFSLSVRYSVPEALIALWNRSYGKENTLRLLETFSQKAKLYLKINNTKISDLDFRNLFPEDEIRLLPEPEHSCAVESMGDITEIDAFRAGLFHVQDLSSQYLCGMLDPQPGETVADVCAAPGGKTFTIAEKMNGTGRVCAYDLYPGRVKLIREGAARLGLKNIEAGVRDALSEGGEKCRFDRVLCDVPCSGFGVIRRKPEIRYKDPKQSQELNRIQYGILCSSAGLLKPGGLLVYSTCTLDPAENGEVAGRFLREHPEFEPVRITSPLPRALEEPEHQLTMMPFLTGTDGFFAALFRRKE